MPLKSGYSAEVIASNAKEMIASGHSKSQAWAAAYSKARTEARRAGKSEEWIRKHLRKEGA